MGLMVLGVLLVLVILILAANIRIVPQAHAYILERLGGYKGRGVLEFILRSRFWIVWQREYHSKSRL
mgnify:FL=1